MMNKKSMMYPNVSFVMILLALCSLLALLYFSVGISEGSESYPTIPVSVIDGAPEAGTLYLFVQYGSANRPEGYTVGSWHVEKGQRLSASAKAPATNHARLWFLSASGQWYFLPSQYWDRNEVRNLGHVTCRSEYGVSARSPLPSYHTGFWSAIPQHRVPLFINGGGCGAGSAASRDTPRTSSSSTQQQGQWQQQGKWQQQNQQPQQNQWQQSDPQKSQWRTKDW